MTGINRKYNLEIEVLTPLSIGVGAEKDWVRGIDFVVDGGKLYKLNIKKMLQNGISPEDMSSLFFSKNESGLKAKLAGKLELVSDDIIPITVQSDNDVKAFVKNQLTGKPVLTGSSVKGSLRSVLFQYLGGRTNNGKEVFGSSTEGDEFMRFIKISDADFESTSLVNTKIFNLRKPNNEWLGGWKYDFSTTRKEFSETGFNTLYECLMPQQRGIATLMLSTKIYDKFESEKKPHIKFEKKHPILHDDIISLFSIINKHTKDYLLKEKAFFTKYATDKTEDIINSIDSLLNQIPNDNSYSLLKMSAGAGFHSITGDWQFDDYTQAPLDRKRVREGKVNPKSRKIAVWDNYFSLMGFVKLRNMSDEEVALIEHKRREKVIRQQQEEIAKAEEARKQAESAEKARIEHEKRQEEFNNRIDKIEQLVSCEQYEKALRLYNETKEMYSEFSQNRIDIELIKQHVYAIQMRRESEKLQMEAEKQRKLDNAVPLAERIANAQKIPTLCGNVKTWMKLNEIESLDANNLHVIFEKVKDIISQMKPRERNGLKNLGKDLSNLVGSDTVTQWFSEIKKD